MPFANFKVPEKTLTPQQKAQIITRTTELYAEIYGERARANTMVLVEEVADGGWGISGDVLTLAELGGAAGTGTGEADRAPGTERTGDA
ncbi:4-oxalocrotonate tautomerase family protein [Streptomyces sp. SID11385]|uniref:tautomerase family protein n=1 Tax=Streptomyces sp. SID11385 TaxID=2706031 RepID=UPI0013C9FD43|nr:4-oxalocrotonate tautomerase family protein [Streptomyces sp. SID11385]NEA40778.1 4-oxalocrotonate tautomerase family protein [Streptomyces sp. SID11385]